ncbi:site-specific integrase [Halomonas sp. EGI 63088]|uniref:Site-specific integrase n=1 Tax=Halomonas flagellata TaxID=2920385 RepID=A0ABS9RZ22_9GAMM|nr:tyrosine-type recombinase/integrase [Halomonas flagellata]MCH4565112.1 site-specific integrase [Halomonas flagellata]
MSKDTQWPAPVGQSASISIRHVDEELQDYDTYLRDLRGLSPGSRQRSLGVVRRLLRQKFGDGVVDIARLHPDDVRQFLADQLAARRTPSNASLLASGLRSYLRYRSTCGDAVSPLAAVISSPAHWKLAVLPRALTVEEVEQLLSSFRFARRWPKRGYAMVRCALDLGLRSGEIARLKIDDIDWQAGTVTLRGTKSFRQDILPLPVETGQAIADYLQHERPPSASSAIFVRPQAPRGEPCTAVAVQKIITRAYRRSGIPHSGSHALRHTFACRLVEHGCSLKEVADLLHHRSLTTAQIYAKLDTPQLSTVPLPWPGGES